MLEGAVWHGSDAPWVQSGQVARVDHATLLKPEEIVFVLSPVGIRSFSLNLELKVQAAGVDFV